MKGRARDVVVVAASKKAPHAVVAKDLEPSEVINTQRPSLAVVEQNHPDQCLVYVALGFEQNLSSGPQCKLQTGKVAARKANPPADFVLRQPSCRKGRAQVFERLNIL